MRQDLVLVGDIVSMWHSYVIQFGPKDIMRRCLVLVEDIFSLKRLSADCRKLDSGWSFLFCNATTQSKRNGNFK